MIQTWLKLSIQTMLFQQELKKWASNQLKLSMNLLKLPHQPN